MEHKNIHEHTEKWTIYKIRKKCLIALSLTENTRIMIKLEQLRLEPPSLIGKEMIE